MPYKTKHNTFHTYRNNPLGSAIADWCCVWFVLRQGWSGQVFIIILVWWWHLLIRPMCVLHNESRYVYCHGLPMPWLESRSTMLRIHPMVPMPYLYIIGINNGPAGLFDNALLYTYIYIIGTQCACVCNKKKVRIIIILMTMRTKTNKKRGVCGRPLF